jgi:hypothetical protein
VAVSGPPPDCLARFLPFTTGDFGSMAVYGHDLAAIILLPGLATWLIHPQGLKSATR